MVFEDRFFNELRRMQKSLNRFFSDFDSYEDEDSPWNIDLREESFGDYRRAVSDFDETENEYIVEIELPGMNKEDIDLNVKNNSVEVKAKKKQEKSDEKEEGSFYAKSFAGFYQSITLPEDADSDNIEAEYKNGILTLKIPKKPSSDKDKGKYIRIK